MLTDRDVAEIIASLKALSANLNVAAQKGTSPAGQGQDVVVSKAALMKSAEAVDKVATRLLDLLKNEPIQVRR